jgi:single-strand DNA-binding protein
MAGWQQVIIVGNVGRIDEMKYLQSGTPVVNFTVAVNEVFGTGDERKEKTVWFRVAAWRRLAETVHQYVTKGQQIMVIGTVDTRAYTDNSGQPAATLELTARDIRFLGTRADREAGTGSGEYGEYQAPANDVGDIPF